MKLNRDQVKQFLPHRDPFLFIDELVGISLPKKIEDENRLYTDQDLIGGETHCRYYLKDDHVIFKGHFPQYPILPGVIQIEMIAQASSFLLLHTTNKPLEQIKIDCALLGVHNAKFRKPIYPNHTLDIYAELVRSRSGMMVYQGRIEIDKQLHSNVEFIASLKFT